MLPCSIWQVAVSDNKIPKLRPIQWRIDPLPRHWVVVVSCAKPLNPDVGGEVVSLDPGADVAVVKAAFGALAAWCAHHAQLDLFPMAFAHHGHNRINELLGQNRIGDEGHF